jgi:hypothetical protein
MNLKRSMLRIILVGAIALMGLGSSAVLAEPNAQDEAPVLGAVNIIISRLFMIETGATEEAYITQPTVFDPGEVMRTDETGVALITWFYDGTETVVNSSTRLTLNAFSGGVADDFVLDLELHEGHNKGGIGNVASEGDTGSWTITTPAFMFKVVRGQFEVSADADGNTQLIVTEGRVEVMSGPDDDTPLVVDANSYIIAGANSDPGEGDIRTLSEDGMTVALDGVCKGIIAPEGGGGVNIRLAPTENSRRLGDAPEGQELWVRSSTEGNLWVQVYYQTDVTDEEGHNYGWVFGPAVTLNEESCATLVRSVLAAELYGGEGIDAEIAAEAEAASE